MYIYTPQGLLTFTTGRKIRKTAGYIDHQTVYVHVYMCTL